MQANKKRAATGLMGLFLLTGLGASLLFWQLSGKPRDWFRWSKPDPLAQAIQLIQERYVDLIPADSLQGVSLDSLMNRLDPHSAYLDPSILRTANEDLAGHFAGIGVGFNRIRDTVTIVGFLLNSPSKAAGVKIGDQILAIGDRSLVGPTINDDSIRLLVRGPVGSLAPLTIRRQGKIQKLSIKRADISNPAVSAAYLLDDSTGYIQLTKFSAGSYREAVMALEKLVEKGMTSLILDLRSNGGGFLQEAIELADEFLPDDRLIVYTEGAHLKKKSYFCKRPGLFEKGNLTLLMNEISASASEVLAGAMQDWCRAKIIGRRSFGKGLVQEQYDLSNQGAIRLTVARYYTPLGRCIQRPYQRDRTAYLHEALSSDPSQRTTTSTQFLNTCGDTLYAGGGILPDVLVSYTSPTLKNPEAEQLLSSPAVILLANRFYFEHQTKIDSVSDLSKLALQPPDTDLQIFLRQQYFSSGAIINPSDWAHIGFEIYAQIARIKKGDQEYVQIQNLRDPFVQAAWSSKTQH